MSPGDEARGGHLVEQRLEQVIVVAVDQRDRHARPREARRAGEAAEAGADDHNARHAVERECRLAGELRELRAQHAGEQRIERERARTVDDEQREQEHPQARDPRCRPPS